MGTQKKEGYSVKISGEAKELLDKAHKLTGGSRVNIIEEAVKFYCSEIIEIIEAIKNPEQRAEILKVIKKNKSAIK